MTTLKEYNDAYVLDIAEPSYELREQVYAILQDKANFLSHQWDMIEEIFLGKRKEMRVSVENISGDIYSLMISFEGIIPEGIYSTLFYDFPSKEAFFLLGRGSKEEIQLILNKLGLRLP
ncbi:MAG: hypothetical protein GXP45_02325 [bacterium]|nr:hypothetical protein [bacterium]